MNLPHWLRHDWGRWVPFHGRTFMGATIDAQTDVRQCRKCGRRQRRSA